MTLSEIRTRLEDLYGPAATNETTYYNRLINDAYRELCGITTWWFLEKQTIIRTTGIAISVTVDATQDSDLLTPESFSAIDNEAYDGGWLATGNHVYRILEAHNSIGEVKLDSNWIEASNSAAEVNIWQDTYSLPTDFDEIREVIPRGLSAKRPLQHVTPGDMDAETVEIFRDATEFAHKFCIFRETDKDTNYKIRLYPPPDEEAEYVIKYIACPSDMSADSDIPLIPIKFHDAIVNTAKMKLLKDRREDAGVIRDFEIEAEKSLRRLWAAHKTQKGVFIKFGRTGIKQAGYMPYKPVNVTSESP